jgi:hypothetical protein
MQCHLVFFGHCHISGLVLNQGAKIGPRAAQQGSHRTATLPGSRSRLPLLPECGKVYDFGHRPWRNGQAG